MCPGPTQKIILSVIYAWKDAQLSTYLQEMQKNRISSAIIFYQVSPLPNILF